MASLALAKQEAKQETAAAADAATSHSLIALQDRVTLFTEEPLANLTATPRSPSSGSAIQDRVWLQPRVRGEMQGEMQEKVQAGAPGLGRRQDRATVAVMAASARAAARVAAAKAAARPAATTATTVAAASDAEHRRAQTNVSPQLARARAHRRRSEGGRGTLGLPPPPRRPA